VNVYRHQILVTVVTANPFAETALNAVREVIGDDGHALIDAFDGVCGATARSVGDTGRPIRVPDAPDWESIDFQRWVTDHIEPLL
jgi:hypothetical protein